jgi:hypothetical protein
MRSECIRRLLVRGTIVSGALLCTSLAALGQSTVQYVPAGAQPSGSRAEVRELAGLIQELRVQVQDLNSQVSELRAQQEQAGKETQALRHELELAKSPLVASAPEKLEAKAPVQESPTSLTQGATIARIAPEEDQSPSARIARLEDDVQLLDSKVTDQAQTKMESGSKYRLRVSGLVLLNLFDSRGTVDNLDNPEVANPPDLFGSPGSFAGTLRQSQIKLETFGPDVAGARTSANIQFDFAGGFVNESNAVSMGLMRLRTGIIRFDWANTSLVAGQDRLFFAPLSPTSLASLSVPPLSYAGNLWGWTPQVRVEHKIAMSENSSVLIQAGILDNLTGDLPQSDTDRIPSWGEESGQPAYATRIAWTHRVFGQNVTVGAGGYYGRQNWGLNRRFDGWTGTTDVTIPLGKQFAFSAAFYRGRGAGGLGGAIGQTVLFKGSFLNPSTVFHGLDSEGGWSQLKFKPKSNFEINGAFGIDSPFAGEMRNSNANLVYPESYTRNMSFLINFIYQVRSDILFSTEYRFLQTSILDSGSNTAHQATLSLGYIF